VNLEHVQALRRVAQLEGGRLPRTQVTAPEIVELAEAGLLAWHGGCEIVGNDWRPSKPPGYVVTPAGRAALLFFELGREAR
jgi:hypothetical protein